MNRQKMEEDFRGWYNTTYPNTAWAPSEWTVWQAACASRQKEIDRLQSKIDAIMLEFCPDEMTKEQLANWDLNQRPGKENQND